MNIFIRFGQKRWREEEEEGRVGPPHPCDPNLFEVTDLKAIHVFYCPAIWCSGRLFDRMVMSEF